MSQVIYYQNSNIIELRGLKNVVTGEYLDAASVTVTLLDSSDSEVTGESWPLTMDYVTSSSGIYRATLSSSLGVSKASNYTAVIEADGGVGLAGKWEVALKCLQRSS